MVMDIITAKSAGFCFGVKRAVDAVYSQVEKDEPIYTYGPIIHNANVVNDFEAKGVKVIEGESGLGDLPKGTLIIRSHGVSRHISEQIAGQQMAVVDATCPFVKKIHATVEQQSSMGRQIIIVGNRNHPEVEGIIGWCNEQPAITIETVEEAQALALPDAQKVCIVAQTTFNYKKFQDIVEKISKKGYDISVVNTICNATRERQEEAKRIAGQVDGMLVIGDKSSSNTQKLYEICRRECKDTYYIQTAAEIKDVWFQTTKRVGITAGASTPNNIIEEVQKHMSELSFEQLLEESLRTIRSGEVVKGKVIAVKEDEIVLNIGYKADGIITRNEYTRDSSLDLRTVVNIDDEVEAKVLKVNDGDGQVALSYRRLQSEKGSKVLEEAFENKTVLTGTVSQVLSGGLSVVIDDTRIFIPASLVSDVYEKNLEKYNGQEVEFVLTEFNPKKRRIIGDCKQLLVAKKAKMQEELFARLEVGQVVDGIVKNVTDFGAFVDLGGADGLLHISEMSWGRIENPKKVFNSGDEVTVLVKDITGTKIALSMKFPEANPWVDAYDKYAVGNIVTGVVARMTDFGAFVELEPGVDALLHVSQIAIDHVEKPSDALQIGQEVTAKVVDFNEDAKRISLSVKALMLDEMQDGEYYEDMIEEDFVEEYAEDAVAEEEFVEE